mmetsp:Transcript_70861/g.220128  ORF Transcript_70861/g.220128 Transcript_70861/m.220128 type:complete len:99 (-) Transcript_70861:681-977(-)
MLRILTVSAIFYTAVALQMENAKTSKVQGDTCVSAIAKLDMSSDKFTMARAEKNGFVLRYSGPDVSKSKKTKTVCLEKDAIVKGFQKETKQRPNLLAC